MRSIGYLNPNEIPVQQQSASWIEHTDDYLLYQARQFHTAASGFISPNKPSGPVLLNLLIAVEYLIELEEKRRYAGGQCDTRS